jgi:hypothetical protein
MKTSKRSSIGDALTIYLPDELIAKIDQAKGQYFSRSKIIAWALNEYFQGNDLDDGIKSIIKTIPQGAGSRNLAPSRNHHSLLARDTITDKPNEPDQEGSAAGVS